MKGEAAIEIIDHFESLCNINVSRYQVSKSLYILYILYIRQQMAVEEGTYICYPGYFNTYVSE